MELAALSDPSAKISKLFLGLLDDVGNYLPHAERYRAGYQLLKWITTTRGRPVPGARGNGGDGMLKVSAKASEKHRQMRCNPPTGDPFFVAKCSQVWNDRRGGQRSLR